MLYWGEHLLFDEGKKANAMESCDRLGYGLRFAEGMVPPFPRRVGNDPSLLVKRGKWKEIILSRNPERSVK